MAAQSEQRIVLTGASSGIGRKAARELAARGARLGLIARRANRLEELADEIAADGHPPPLVLPTDLGEPGAAKKVAARAEEQLGRVDVLVNNAGASIQGLSWVAGDCPEARTVFETNVWSPLALIAAFAPGMIERGGGAIVNTGSMAQVSPFPHLGHYSASRSALAAITETLRLELAPRGIRVVEVALGPVDTAGSTENRLLEGGAEWLEGRPGIGKLEEAAQILVDAVEGSAEGVVFYPKMLRFVHALPGLGRRYAKAAARRTDLEDTAIRVGGSSGSAAVRAERERWEREHPPA
jgi:short-subunit dehydrogenase